MTLPLVERDRDLAVIAQSVAGAMAGEPGVLVIEGPPGIGKTLLLTEGKRLATEAGARVLSARASEFESDFAFGVARQLLEHTEDGEWVGTPSATVGEDVGDASFAILHSLYRSIAATANRGPLVVAVDDIHWCDEPSLRFLSYVIRRLESVGAAILCTMRPRQRWARSSLMHEIVADPASRLVCPTPLSVEATERLIGAGFDTAADPVFVRACHTATGGNPLLLRELITTMHVEGVRPDHENLPAISALGSRAISRSVLVRLGRLGGAAEQLARAASVLGPGVDLGLAASVAALDAEDAAIAATALVNADVFADDTDVAFVHPLVGAAVYQDMAAVDRSLVHEQAARQLHARGRAADGIAGHLLLAPARGQEWVCDVLEAAARDAVRAGMPAVAVGYLQRALTEPAPPLRRARLLLDLGTARAAHDGAGAVAHLTEALELGADGIRGPAAVALVRTLLMHTRVVEAHTVARRVAVELDTDADARLALEALDLMATIFTGGRQPSVDQIERSVRHGGGPGAKMLAAIASRQLAYGGAHAAECVRLAQHALHGGDLFAADQGFLSVTAILTLVRADWPEAESHWEQLHRDAGMRGSLAAKSSSSLWRGYAHLFRGELDKAEVSLADAWEEYRLLDPELVVVHHAAFHSAVRRERGDLVGARRALEAVAPPPDASDLARYWLDAQVELLLAEQRFDEAYSIATAMEERFGFIANPIDTPIRSHRARAQWHLGRHDAAIMLAHESLELAQRWGAPAGLARALRVLGTFERAAGIDRLRAAVETAEASPARLELAKSLVALGSSLRRAREQSKAREPLRRGFELAETLGAAALAATARHELRASGARVRTTATTGPAALTPSELRVAERAAAGQSNRVIAEGLFVTTKTVELHLSNAYRKLGVRSRTELPDKLA